MKRYLYILFAAAAVMAASCEKTSLLDKPSYTGIDGDQAVTTQKGLDLLLNGIYDDVSSHHYYGGILYLYDATKSPDFFMRNVGGGFSFYTENGYSTSSNINGNPRNIWLKCYNVIRNCTILLENINNASGTIEELRRIKGQAYALRALAYFDLLRLFAYPPKYSCTWGSSFSDTFALGVPIINSMAMAYDVKDHVITRSSADECWHMIADEMSKAVSLLEDTDTEDGHIGPAAALALRIRIALYMEDYQTVVTLGKKWLNEYEGNYSMLNYDSYPYQYYKPFNTESVWELKYSENDNLGGNAINYWVRKQTWNIPGSPLDGQVSKNVGYAKLGLTYGTPTSGLECMQTYPLDVRQYLVCTLGIPFTDYKTLRRYVGDPYHNIHNIPVVRLPEIYFALAEAYYKRANVEAAREMLAKVTSVRRKDYAPKIDNLNDILDEMRREFMLEGHNYFDWFRNGRNITNRPVIGCITSSGTITFGVASGLGIRVVYPIPLDEMTANRAIRTQQNPGYGSYSERVESEDDVY